MFVCLCVCVFVCQRICEKERKKRKVMSAHNMNSSETESISFF